MEHGIPFIFRDGGKGIVSHHSCVAHYTEIDAIFLDVCFKDFTALLAIANVELQHTNAAAQFFYLPLYLHDRVNPLVKV
jgi:hypothetical protein